MKNVLIIEIVYFTGESFNIGQRKKKKEIYYISRWEGLMDSDDVIMD